jgi:hypothetical protein
MRWRLLACWLGCPIGTMAAQDTTKATRAPMPAERNIPCAGQRISDIIVITQPPYTARLPGDLEILRKAVRELHSTTRDIVIRRYLLLNAGDRCDEVRRAESERILRVQPFLVDARISTIADPSDNGEVRLVVETRDEFSLLVSGRVTLQSPVVRGFGIGESNLAGSGIYALLQWKTGRAYRDFYSARLEDYQVGGERNVLRLRATQLPQGHEYNAEFLRPYLTDLQHVAWHAKVGGTRSYDPLLRQDFDNNAIGVDREAQDLGAVARVGEVGRLNLVGLSLSREQVNIDPHSVRITRDGFVNDVPVGLPRQFRSQAVTRINALVGVRRLRFARVYGFDALNGVQDIRVGVQIGSLLGRSIPWFGARDKDVFVLGDIYAGYGNAHSWLGMQTLTEARRDRAAQRWQGVLTSGRVAWYLKPAIKQLTLTEILWATGTSVQVPYQLSFADREGGMIGYHNTRTPGAHRVVIRTEQRALITSRFNVADFGAAVFAEAGKLWADHVPYGVATPVRGSVGVSLFAAVPPKSRRMWRVDFGMPVGGDRFAKFEIRITSQDRTRTFWKDPPDVARARERAVPTSIFTWP